MRLLLCFIIFVFSLGIDSAAAKPRGRTSQNSKPCEGCTQPCGSPAQVNIGITTDSGPAKPITVPIEFQPQVAPTNPIKVPITVEITPQPKPTASPGHDGAEDRIGGISTGDLLTLVVALAAYMAALRFFMQQRLGDFRKEERNLRDRLTVANRPASAQEAGEPFFNPEPRTVKDLDKLIKSVEVKQLKTTNALALLVPADFFFVLLAILLTLRLFGKAIGIPQPGDLLVSTLFLVAILYLAGLHFAAWVDTWSRHKMIREEKHMPSRVGKWLAKFGIQEN